jgi:hypothetical protein
MTSYHTNGSLFASQHDALFDDGYGCALWKGGAFQWV